MRLFLTSYLAGTKGLANRFLSKARPREIVFVPTAANVEEYRGYVDEGMAALREMGYGLRVLDVAAVPRRGRAGHRGLRLPVRVRRQHLLPPAGAEEERTRRAHRKKGPAGHALHRGVRRCNNRLSGHRV